MPRFNVLMLDLETVLCLLMPTNAAAPALTIMLLYSVEGYKAEYRCGAQPCSTNSAKWLASLTSISC